MISRLGSTISRAFRALVPDPFIIAIILTLFTGAIILLQTRLADGSAVDHSLADVVNFWNGGVWSLLQFAMQMCLILVTGHALASSPPVARALRALASLPRNAVQGVLIVALVAMLLAVLNWGLGLIAGALMAREVGRVLDERDIPHHYPLLAAAGYLGLLVWHGGLSGSAPLKVTDPKEVAEVFKGLDVSFATIPLDETVLSTMNFMITGGLIIVAAIVVVLLVPRSDQPMQRFRDFDVPGRDPAPGNAPLRSLPDWLEHTPVFSLLLAIPILALMADLFVLGAGGGDGVLPLLPETEAQSWKRLTPNHVNLLFLGLGLIMHGTPRRYLIAVEEAVRGCSGIILQFPLYAGIMGMMKASGMTELMSQAIAANSTETSLPVTTLASASIVNLFVPSGGGQWAVQGPIAMQAASDIGASPAKMVMAVAYGDQLTNMLQPFWALPLLAITGVKARDIVGYTAIIMVVAAVWLVVGLLLF